MEGLRPELRAEREGRGWGQQAGTNPYLPILSDHDVVAVPIANAQHVRGHAVAGAGQGELLNGSVQSLPGWEEGGLETTALDALQL